MRMKWLAVVFLPGFLLPASFACAGAKAVQTPTVVVRVRSLDALLQNLNLVVRLVGQEEAANQIEGLVKSKIGKQGLEGIDPARPFGAYVRFGKDIEDITGAILVPMVDEKTFLTLLENVGVNFTKDKDNIYTHKTNKNFNLYFRFANKYLYITSVNTDSIQDKNLLDPARALDITGNATISLVAHLDQVPSAAKLIALAQLEESLLAAQKKGPPNETKLQEEFRIALLRELNRLGSSLIREAAQVRFDLEVEGKKELTVNFAVTGKPDSDLAKAIQGVGSLQSTLTVLPNRAAAFHGALHLTLPADLNKALISVIDEVTEKSIEGIQNAEKKKQAEALFKAMSPSVKAGEFQIVAAVLGPQDKHYTFVAGVKLKEGDQLGKTVHELLKDALSQVPADQREKFQLDFDRVGAVKIHKFEIPKNAKLDKFLEEMAGDNHLYIAFRDDALFMALGKEALAALKSVVAKKDNAASLPLIFDFDVARMAPLMAQTQEQKDLAKKLFGDGQDGRVRLTVEGGARLNLRLRMQLNVVEFLVKMKNDKGS